MKRKLLFVFALCAGFSTVKAQNIPSYVPTNGLVGWWPFNGNANDESGNGNNGTVNGATLTTDRDGASSKAYSFNGNGNYIEVKNSSSLFTSYAMTISIWHKNKKANYDSYNKSNYGTLLTKATNNKSDGFWLDVISSSNQNDLNCNNGFLKSVISIGDNNKSSYGANNQNVPCSDSSKWEHIVYSFDRGTLKTYVNSVLVDTKTLSVNSIPMNSLSMYFGYRVGNSISYYNGKMDDIAIYNRSLLDSEIKLLYTRCLDLSSTITPQGNTNFCDGNSVDLTANTGTNYTYQWYNNNQLISNATNVTYKATTSGNYTVKVTDGACNVTSSAIVVTVNPLPNVSLASLGSVVYKSGTPITLQGSPSGGTYSGEGVTNTSFNPALATLGRKTITYNYTSPQGCSGQATRNVIVVDTLGNVCSTYDTLKIKFKLTTGIKTNELTSVIAFPNPTSDVLIISAFDVQALGGYKYKIVDIQGKELYNKAVTTQKTEISLNTLGAKGVYILHILDANGTSIENKKIVLE
jgi:hypothetical protein